MVKFTHALAVFGFLKERVCEVQQQKPAKPHSSRRRSDSLTSCVSLQAGLSRIDILKHWTDVLSAVQRSYNRAIGSLVLPVQNPPASLES